jgi:hemerythrin
MAEYPTPLLPLDRIPQVALESMNRTHQEEVERVNRLAALVAKGMQGEIGEATISAHLENLIDHTRQHFARENALMEQYGFPAYAVHSGEHQRVLSQLDNLLQGWLKERSLEPLAEFLFAEWPSWFDNHVQTMDRVTAGFLQQAAGGSADI